MTVTKSTHKAHKLCSPLAATKLECTVAEDQRLSVYFRDQLPLSREAEPADIAAVVCFRTVEAQEVRPV